MHAWSMEDDLGGAGQGTVKTAHDGAAGVVIIRYPYEP